MLNERTSILSVSLKYRSRYRKIPKYLDARKIAVIILKFEQCGSSRSPNDADGMANRSSPSPLGAV